MAKIERFSTKQKEISAVGTGHVLQKSLQAVKSEIQDFAPEAVALELDLPRFLALTKKKKRKPKGIAERLLFELQSQAGKTTGVRPGAEMLAAAREARRHNIPVVLIDRDIRITLRRAFGGMTIKEKLKLLAGVVGGFFEVRDKSKLDSLISQKDELMVEFRRELPSAYRALVTERDAYMSKAISALPYSRVLLVVGAGHLSGIRKRLEYRK